MFYIILIRHSIGFAILVADGLVKFSSVLESSRLPSKILNFGIVASFAFLVAKTEFRISAWKTKENLFHSGLTVHRHNAKAEDENKSRNRNGPVSR